MVANTHSSVKITKGPYFISPYGYCTNWISYFNDSICAMNNQLAKENGLVWGTWALRSDT